jgi:hypothetical protein
MAYFSSSSFLFFCRIFCIFVFTVILTHAQAPDKTAEGVKSPLPPVVEFQAQPLSEKLKIGEKNPVFVTIANKSALKIENINISCPEGKFVLESSNELSKLGPFQNTTARVTLSAAVNTSFNKYKLPLILSYTYVPESSKSVSSATPAQAKSRVQSTPQAAPQAASAQIAAQTSALIDIDVVRNFDEEAKGFPGGTAAFLYLLLPVIPAMLSFRFANNLRKGLGPQMPAFKSEDIVPAFLFAVVLSLIVLLIFDLDLSLGLSNTIFFLVVLAASVVAGVMIPVILYFYGLWKMAKWGFRESDTDREYLRKALLSKYSPKEYDWATGKIGADTFAGVLLNQPTGKIVFGAIMQVSPKDGDDYDTCLEELAAQVFNGGILVNKKRLLQMLDSGKAVLSKKTFAKQNNRTVPGPVVIPPNGETELTSNPVEIVVLVP